MMHPAGLLLVVLVLCGVLGVVEIEIAGMPLFSSALCSTILIGIHFHYQQRTIRAVESFVDELRRPD